MNKQDICNLLNGKTSPEEIAAIFGLKHEDGIYKIRGRKPKERPLPPTEEEFVFFFKHNGYDPEIGKQAYLSYAENDWRDSNNKPVINWKMKIRQVWLKPHHKLKEKPKTGPVLSAPRKML